LVTISGRNRSATHRFTRPTRLLIDATLPYRPAAPVPAEPDPFLILDQPSAPRPRIRVDGPIDAHTAPTLYQHLQTATGAGTRP